MKLQITVRKRVIGHVTAWISAALVSTGSSVAFACTEFGLEQSIADLPDVPAEYFAGDDGERAAAAPELTDYLETYSDEFTYSLVRGLSELAKSRGQSSCRFDSAKIASTGKSLYSVTGHVKIRTYPITLALVCTPLPGQTALRVSRRTTIVVKHQLISGEQADSCYGMYGASGIYLRF